MFKARIKVFSEMDQNPVLLADVMTERINKWLNDKEFTYDDIHHFASNMNAGQDGENGNALWYCYTATIVYSE
jgi:hypothetical protein